MTLSFSVLHGVERPFDLSCPQESRAARVAPGKRTSGLARGRAGGFLIRKSSRQVVALDARWPRHLSGEQSGPSSCPFGRCCPMALRC